MLLFWPCAWGLTLAYDFSTNLKNYFFYLILFFLGSVLMRSAGCIVNDILDKEFDAKVFRTKNRPIASGKISIKLGIFYTVVLCSLAVQLSRILQVCDIRSCGISSRCSRARGKRIWRSGCFGVRRLGRSLVSSGSGGLCLVVCTLL